MNDDDDARGGIVDWDIEVAVNGQIDTMGSKHAKEKERRKTEASQENACRLLVVGTTHGHRKAEMVAAKRVVAKEEKRETEWVGTIDWVSSWKKGHDMDDCIPVEKEISHCH